MDLKFDSFGVDGNGRASTTWTNINDQHGQNLLASSAVRSNGSHRSATESIGRATANNSSSPSVSDGETGRSCQYLADNSNIELGRNKDTPTANGVTVLTKQPLKQRQEDHFTQSDENDIEHASTALSNNNDYRRFESLKRQQASEITPWCTQGKVYHGSVIGLHDEIVDFFHWMLPTPTEARMRFEVIARIEDLVTNLWPSADVRVFGSYKTGLYLPTSDIDISIRLREGTSLSLFTLERSIKSANIADENKIRVLDKASVPIIKFTDRLSNVRVDISFNIRNDKNSAELICNYIKKYPALPYLVLVLKQFLLQRELNEVYSGGISSYSLILMAVSFLQLHPRAEELLAANVNYGVLLIEFFELYGRHFNYVKTGIRVSEGGAYIPKNEIWRDGNGTHGQSILCIEDPLDRENDIGRSSYGAIHVKQAFEYAYAVLSRSVTALSVNQVPTFLGKIISINRECREYRDWVQKNWFKNAPQNQSCLSKASTPILAHLQNRTRVAQPNAYENQPQCSQSGISSVDLPTNEGSAQTVSTPYNGSTCNTSSNESSLESDYSSNPEVCSSSDSVSSNKQVSEKNPVSRKKVLRNAGNGVDENAGKGEAKGNGNGKTQDVGKTGDVKESNQRALSSVAHNANGNGNATRHNANQSYKNASAKKRGHSQLNNYSGGNGNGNSNSRHGNNSNRNNTANNQQGNNGAPQNQNPNCYNGENSSTYTRRYFNKPRPLNDFIVAIPIKTDQNAGSANCNAKGGNS